MKVLRAMTTWVLGSWRSLYRASPYEVISYLRTLLHWCTQTTCSRTQCISILCFYMYMRMYEPMCSHVCNYIYCRLPYVPSHFRSLEGLVSCLMHLTLATIDLQATSNPSHPQHKCSLLLAVRNLMTVSPWYPLQRSQTLLRNLQQAVP